MARSEHHRTHSCGGGKWEEEAGLDHGFPGGGLFLRSVGCSTWGKGLSLSCLLLICLCLKICYEVKIVIYGTCGVVGSSYMKCLELCVVHNKCYISAGYYH